MSVSATVANLVAASPLWSPRRRGQLLRRCGVGGGRGARIGAGIRFLGEPHLLRLGSGAYLNAGVVIGGNATVRIGDHVHIGPGAQLLPTTHALGPSERRAGPVSAAPIEIGAGAWLGAGVIVLGGVTIGAGAVVAAGAVVQADVAADTLVGGVPARTIRSLEGPP